MLQMTFNPRNKINTYRMWQSIQVLVLPKRYIECKFNTSDSYFFRVTRLYNKQTIKNHKVASGIPVTIVVSQ